MRVPGPVLRDLFADEYENGVWLEDPKLLNELATAKLTAAGDELATRWKWADAMLEVDWSATARYGRIHPQPSEPTDAETAEIERLRAGHDELGLCCKLGEGAMRDQGASCSPYDSALARRSCSHAMASVRAHGPRPKARSTIRASPTMPPWRANIPAWPLRSARITSKPLIVA